MAEQTTEVVLKLNVETGDGSKAMQGLAADTKKAGDAAKGTQKEFDALGEAQKRLHAQDRERAVRQQMERLRPGPGPAGFDPHARAREAIQAGEQQRQVEQVRRQIEQQRQQSMPWYARNAGSFAGAANMAAHAAPYATAAYAARGVVGAAGSAANEIGERMAAQPFGVSETEVTNIFARKLAEAVPVIGGFIQSLGEAGRYLSGLDAERRGHVAGLEAMERQRTAANAEIAGRAELREKQFGLGVGVSDAQAAARASAAYRDSLTPERTAGYYQRARFGEATEQTGELRRQADLAAAQIAAIAERENHARKAVDDQRARQAAADARVAEAQRAIGGAQGRFNTAEVGVANAEANRMPYVGGFTNWAQDLAHSAPGLGAVSPLLGAIGLGRGFGESETTLARRRQQDASANIAQLGGGVNDARDALGHEREATERRINDLKEIQKQKAEAVAEAERRKLAVQREQTVVLQKQVLDASRSAALEAGLGSHAEQAELTQLAEMFQKHGRRGLAPEMLQRLANDKVMGPVVREVSEREGAQDSELLRRQQINSQMMGRNRNIPRDVAEFAGKPLNQQEVDWKKIAGEHDKAMADLNARTDQQMAKIRESETKEIGEIIGKGYDAMLAKMKQEILNQLAKRGLLNTG